MKLDKEKMMKQINEQPSKYKSTGKRISLKETGVSLDSKKYNNKKD